MPQPIEEGMVLGGRYLITGHVLTSADQDMVLDGLDQVLNRDVAILVASSDHASQVAASARELATGERQGSIQVLDLGLSEGRTYLIAGGSPAPEDLLDMVQEQQVYVEPFFTDTLGSEIFGEARTYEPQVYEDDDEYYEDLDDSFTEEDTERRRPKFLRDISERLSQRLGSHDAAQDAVSGTATGTAAGAATAGGGATTGAGGHDAREDDGSDAAGPAARRGEEQPLPEMVSDDDWTGAQDEVTVDPHRSSGEAGPRVDHGERDASKEQDVSDTPGERDVSDSPGDHDVSDAAGERDVSDSPVDRDGGVAAQGTERRRPKARPSLSERLGSYDATDDAVSGAAAAGAAAAGAQAAETGAAASGAGTAEAGASAAGAKAGAAGARAASSGSGRQPGRAGGDGGDGDDDAHDHGVDTDEPYEEEDKPRGARWITGGILVLLLILGAVFAFNILGNSRQPVAEDGTSAGPGISENSPDGQTADQLPDPVPVSASRVVPDSPGLSAETDSTLPNAIDGNPATAWQTYSFAQPVFGGYASSMALVIELEEPSAVDQVDIIQNSGSGGSFTVSLSDTPELADARQVAQGSFTGPQVSVPVNTGDGDPAPAQYVIINFTELPQLSNASANLPYGLRIAEVQVQ